MTWRGISRIGIGVVMLTALLTSTAFAQWQNPPRGYWPYGCRTTSGTTCGGLGSETGNSQFYAVSDDASAAHIYCLPDSLVAPPGYMIQRLDIWNQSRDPNILQELLVVAQVFSRNITSKASPNTWEWSSDHTASWNTSFYLQQLAGNVLGAGYVVPARWTFPIRTERVWFKASGATANWGWCGYCLPEPGRGATEATIYWATGATVSSVHWPSLTQPIREPWVD